MTSGESRAPYALQMSYDKKELSGFRSLKIDVQQTGMDERQLLTFNSLGADPQIGITLARRNRTEALVWGLALAVFVLGVALTTPARAAEGCPGARPGAGLRPACPWPGTP